ncbi:hypothetical protein ACFFTM_09550 [Pseudoduganella plicata]|uniref:Uncharacterized protein n=1 Tax=Pseudoduganella plicata TaxID=321984 RepID=A0AA88C9N5_9BURK|nr:hypothetical protein [Pseudoduganella plicata]GGZ00651.1 hypothetical protein GCM10007388_37700 [Pseudoduganella plicata]
MTMKSNEQQIISAAGAGDVAIREIQHIDVGPALHVILENGDVWSIAPGPDWSYTVTAPDGREQLVELATQHVVHH